VNAPLVNFGTLQAAPGTNVLNGAVTNVSGALLRLNGNNGFADVTIANGFTNNGMIELTGTSWAGRLSVGSPTAATLVNAAGATLQTVAGVGNVLTAALNNQGTVQVGGPLTMNAPAAGHSNSGLIKLSGGDLNVQFSSGRPGLSNTGTIDVGTNKMVIGGPASSFINQNSGTLLGSGTFDVTGTSFITNGTTVVGGSPGTLTFVGPYLQGPGTPNPSVMKVEIGGTTSDLLQATDNVDIQGGTLDVTLTGAVSGQTYVIMQVPAGKTITGDFQTKLGLAVPKCTSAVSGTQYRIICP
jgi:hypothetical protein